MRRVLLALTSLLSLSLAATGCDSLGGGSTNTGPLTRCDLSIVEKNPGTGDFLEGCETDADCDFGSCMKPGDGGNLTNTAFGFCTRACDCGEDVASRLSSDEKAARFSCLYPPTPFQHQRHVVMECSGSSQCQEIDARWNACRMPSSGGARAICHAD